METLFSQVDWTTVQFATIFFCSGMLTVALPMWLAHGLPLRKANRQYVTWVRINMLTVEEASRGAYSIAQDPEKLRAAYDLAKEIFAELQERGLTVRHLGYTYAGYQQMIKRLEQHCRHAGALASKTSARPSFIPEYDQAGNQIDLLWSYDPDTDGIEFIDAPAPRVSLSPPTLPSIAVPTAQEESAMADFLRRRFVPRGDATPDTPAPIALPLLVEVAPDSAPAPEVDPFEQEFMATFSEPPSSSDERTSSAPPPPSA